MADWFKDRFLAVFVLSSMTLGTARSALSAKLCALRAKLAGVLPCG